LPLVAVDNQIMVWSTLKKCTAGQEDMLARAAAFVDQMNQDRVRILVPSVVIAEFLVNVPAQRHDDVLSAINARFQVGIFDLSAAKMAADIMRRYIFDRRGQYPEGLQPEQWTKPVIKFDCQVLATAITRGASALYTHDKGLLAMGRDYHDRIEVKEMPFPIQQGLFLPTE
jgi:predicted nucleic acid-binding protein